MLGRVASRLERLHLESTLRQARVKADERRAPELGERGRAAAGQLDRRGHERVIGGDLPALDAGRQLRLVVDDQVGLGAQQPARISDCDLLDVDMDFGARAAQARDPGRQHVLELHRGGVDPQHAAVRALRDRAHDRG